MLGDSIRYAFGSLRRRKLRSWLTIIGIFIGIAAVVSLISLGEGLRDAVEAQFSSLGSDRLTVQTKSAGFGPPGLGASVKLQEEDLRVVKRAQHVDAAAGRLIKPVTVKYKRASRETLGITLPDDRDDREVVEDFLDPVIETGRFITAGDKGSVVFGYSASRDWGQAQQQIVAGDKVTIEGKVYDVVGTLQKKGVPASDQTFIINEGEFRDILGTEDEYSLIVARIVSSQLVNDAKEAIEKDLRKSRDVDERKEDFEVQSSQNILNQLDDILSIITAVLVGIAAISLIVGGIGIMNTMYTAVLERTKEIGIMKAIGATNEQVLELFLIESSLIGFVGALIGVFLGMGFSKVVEFGAVQALGPSVLQANTPMWLIFGALTFGLVVGTFSGIFPARRAARLPPVEALQ